MIVLIASVLGLLIGINLIAQLLILQQKGRGDQLDIDRAVKATKKKVDINITLIGVTIGLIGFEFDSIGYALFCLFGSTFLFWLLARFTMPESLLYRSLEIDKK